MSDKETEEEFFERVQEECRENGHRWIERSEAPTESLSPFITAYIQKLDPHPIYGKLCQRCGEYGLACPSCNKSPEELEDHFLSLQAHGVCYTCHSD